MGVKNFHNVWTPFEPETVEYVDLTEALLAYATYQGVDANIKAIKYGSGVTLSSLTAKFSTVAPTFVTQISQDLRWLAILNATVPITATWNNGTNTLAMYPVAAGTGETLGDALNVSDCANLSYATFDGASATGFHAIAGAAQAGGTADEIAYVAGKLFKMGATLAVTSGSNPNWSFRSALSAASSTNLIGFNSTMGVAGVKTVYGNPDTTTTGVINFRSAPPSEFTISGLYIKNVTAPDSSGFTCSDLSGASFNPNAATFTLNIVRR